MNITVGSPFAESLKSKMSGQVSSPTPADVRIPLFIREASPEEEQSPCHKDVGFFDILDVTPKGSGMETPAFCLKEQEESLSSVSDDD